MAEPGSDISAQQGTPVMTMDQAGKAQHVPLGALSDAAWNGVGNPASLIALWKAIYGKLDAVAINTAP